MKNLEALIIFARVAEMKSFTQAAESLGIQKGRASLVVRELERETGATLLHRTTRTVPLRSNSALILTLFITILMGNRLLSHRGYCRTRSERYEGESSL